MFQPKLPASVDEIRFDNPLFWSLPIEEREGAFLLLRRDRPMCFHKEFEPPPEIPLPRGPGFGELLNRDWALSQPHDDPDHILEG